MFMGHKKPAIFVKDLARHIFGSEALMNSTVTGRLSNRSKLKGAKQPDALDPTVLAAIRGKYIYLCCLDFY